MGAAGKLQKTDMIKVLAIQPLITENFLIAKGSVEINFVMMDTLKPCRKQSYTHTETSLHA